MKEQKRNQKIAKTLLVLCKLEYPYLEQEKIKNLYRKVLEYDLDSFGDFFYIFESLVEQDKQKSKEVIK